MSPRAACRLSQLGFDRVYDYEAGKNDWIAAGLPVEGDAAELTLVGELTVPALTCSPQDSIADVVEKMRAEEAEFCIATTPDMIVLGRVRLADLVSDDDATVEQRWEFGPTTVRASEGPGKLLERMDKVNVDTILVTDASGRLIGVFDRRLVVATEE